MAHPFSPPPLLVVRPQGKEPFFCGFPYTSEFMCFSKVVLIVAYKYNVQKLHSLQYIQYAKSSLSFYSALQYYGVDYQSLYYRFPVDWLDQVDFSLSHSSPNPQTNYM